MKDPDYVQGSDRRRASQLHTGYITMNVKMKPFDDVKCAQGRGNMAVNKDRIVRIINGRAAAGQPTAAAG